MGDNFSFNLTELFLAQKATTHLGKGIICLFFTDFNSENCPGKMRSGLVKEWTLVFFFLILIHQIPTIFLSEWSGS